MWVTGRPGVTSTPAGGRASAHAGFSLLELMAALAIAGLVMALAVPSTMRMYDNISYRQAVRDVVTLFASARYEALHSGRAQTVEVNPEERSVTFAGTVHSLPGSVAMTVHSARELNRGRVGIIRFYPEGGASGGGVDIESASGAGVSITVDWLLGSVSQETYAAR
jgi:general secretion pathway protein H